MGRMSAKEAPEAKLPLERRPSAVSFQLDNLLVQVAAGAVRVPRFQRGLRWDDVDRVDLFDSIYRGYPIGTLLLWKHEADADRISLGKLTLDAPARQDALFVVDGQQRITTLAEVLLRVPSPDERAMHFDLSTTTFEYSAKGRKPGSASDNIKVPLSVVLDASRLMEWILAQPNLSKDQWKLLFDLGKRIREYQVPAYVVETDDEGVLRKIFHRTNSTGKRLEASEVFDGLFGAVGPAHPATLKQLGQSLVDLEFGRLQESYLLNALLAIRGLPLDRPFAEVLAQGDSADGLRRAESALREAIVFLKHDAGIPHVELVPYMLPLIVLSKFFDRFPTPKVRSRALLRRWLWRASLAGRLTGATLGMRQHLACVADGREEESVQRLMALSGADPTVAALKLDSFSFQTARTKMHCCALASLGPRDLKTGKPVVLDKVLSVKEGQADRIPAVVAQTSGLRGEVGGLANRLLVPWLSPKPLRAAIAGVAHGPILTSHAISEEAHRALNESRLAAFLSLRKDALERVVATFFSRQAEWGADDTPSLASMIVDEFTETGS